MLSLWHHQHTGSVLIPYSSNTKIGRTWGVTSWHQVLWLFTHIFLILFLDINNTKNCQRKLFPLKCHFLWLLHTVFSVVAIHIQKTSAFCLWFLLNQLKHTPSPFNLTPFPQTLYMQISFSNKAPFSLLKYPSNNSMKHEILSLSINVLVASRFDEVTVIDRPLHKTSVIWLHQWLVSGGVGSVDLLS